MEKVTVITKSEILIGYIVEPSNNPLLGLMKDGIWLRREKHLSFIGNSEILQIRASTVYDKEIDNRQEY